MKSIKIYEPNGYIKGGLFATYKLMWEELVTGHELGLRLFKRDFSAKFRQSILGVLWVILIPLVSAGVFIILNKSGILDTGKLKVPYVVYALYGLTVWNLFSGLITGIAGTLSSSVNLITKINFTRISLVYSPVLMSVVDFSIRIIILILIMIFTRTMPDIKFIPLTILSLLPLIFLAIGTGLFLTVVSAVFKDLPNFLSIFLNFLMFFSPVIYPVTDRKGLLARIARFNPLTVLLDFPRNLFFEGTYIHWTFFLSVSLICLIIFFAGWRFYYISISKIIEKV